MKTAAMTVALALAASSVTAQVRDRAPARTGTASISGTIVTESQPARPVRRAAVTVNSSDRTIGRTAITDDAGRFAIGSLPAGRYTVEATKGGWVTTAFGAKAPGRPGRSIAIADGERGSASLRMSRAAVITGTVLDQNGLPPTGITIRVLRYAYAFNTGERRLTPAAFTSWGPDERGAYRIWGLAPGEYYVSAYTGGTFTVEGRDLHLTSEVDVQEALRAAQSPSAAVVDVPQPSVGVAPVFYPGTTAVAQATPITVRAGEERGGVDFTLQYVSTSHVAGIVTTTEGTLPTGVQVNLISTDSSAGAFGFEAVRTARPGPDGRFDFAEVTPGGYMLAARVAIPSTTTPPGPARVMSALIDVDIQGEDARGLSLPLQDGLSVSGALQLDGSAPPPPLASMRVNLAPAQGTGISISSAGSPITDGRFTVTGVTPGRYRLTLNVPGQPPTWTVRTATIGGQDTVDTPIEIRESVSDAVITLTDRVAELSGHVSAGPSAADYTILVFSTNRAHWSAPARRTLTARTASDGSYVFRTIPPGEYFLVALDDVEPGEWYDPGFLQRLSPTAIRVSIAEGEKKVQDIKAGGG